MRSRAATKNPAVTIVVAIVGVCIVFALLIANALRTRTTVAENTEMQPRLALNDTVRSNNNLALSSEQDTDGDGLKDWEEVLWNTDPNKVDTDGDSISDADEVARNTDPNDISSGSISTEVLGESVASTTAPKTVTEAVARELLQASLLSMQQKNSVSTEAVGGIVGDAMGLAAKAPKPAQYEKNEVIVIPPSEEASLAYAQGVGKIVKKMHEDNPNEFGAFIKLSSGDRSAASTMRDIAGSYSQQIIALKEMPVPADAVDLHVELVNAIVGYAFALESIGMLEIDPVRSAMALNQFLDVYKQFMIVFMKFDRYFLTEVTPRKPLDEVEKIIREQQKV